MNLFIPSGNGNMHISEGNLCLSLKRNFPLPCSAVKFLKRRHEGVDNASKKSFHASVSADKTTVQLCSKFFVLEKNWKQEEI